MLTKRKRCRECKKSTKDYAGNYMAVCNACKAVVSETTAVRRQLKQRAIEHLGGACRKCGYNTCDRALTFHHKDPDTKDPRLIRKSKSGRGTACQGGSVVAFSRKWEIVKREVDKCVLLCNRCHTELEAGLWHR